MSTRERTPTERQYRQLLNLGSGAAYASVSARKIDALIRHGWVAGQLNDGRWEIVRITPHGFRALAAATERYGLPALRITSTLRIDPVRSGGAQTSEDAS